MPNKTILDELARTLKARKNALNRFDRRTVYNINPNPEFDIRSRREAGELLDRLDDRAIYQYERALRSPDGRVNSQAIKMFPQDLHELLYERAAQEELQENFPNGLDEIDW